MFDLKNNLLLKILVGTPRGENISSQAIFTQNVQR